MLHVIIPPEDLKTINFERFRCQDPIVARHLHALSESVKVAQAEIEKLTGIKRGKTQIREFLHKIGMKPRRVAGIPAKADPVKQEEFKKSPGACIGGGKTRRCSSLFC